MSNVKHLLFISHDAKRTGAPLLLWRFLKLLKKNCPHISFQILLKNGGALESDFAQLAPTYVWNKPIPHEPILWKYLLRKITNKFNKNTAQGKIERHIANTHFDLIVSNTLTNGDLLQVLAPLRAKIITYAHELPISLKLYSTPEAIAYNISVSDYFIVPSQATKENLVRQYQIPASKIEVLLSLLPEQKAKTEQLNTRKLLGIPAGAFVVGSIGTPDLRKGIDLFLQVAAQFKNQNVHFVWVGADKSNPDFFIFEQDCEKMGLQQQVHFVTSTPDVLDYLGDFDIFALFSREDPYPLVVLEAALCGKPIICFDKAGGANELVEHDAGFVVNYLDLKTFAEKTQTLIQDRHLLNQMGEIARTKVFARHDETKALEQFLDILNPG